MNEVLRGICASIAFSLSLLSLFPPKAAAQSDPPLLLRFPTVNKTQIVFNYGGDLWIVSRDGGDARRSSSSCPSERSLPVRHSPP